ncbi:hypothetical protein B296_00057374, partial [Ensete ventricosum]
MLMTQLFDPRFAISICIAGYGQYILVRQVTGTHTARYRVVPPKVDRRRPIEGEIDRQWSISDVGDRLREKKGRRRRRGKAEEEKQGRKKYLGSSSPARRRPRAVVALARFFSCTRRRNVSPCGEKDRGD